MSVPWKQLIFQVLLWLFSETIMAGLSVEGTSFSMDDLADYNEFLQRQPGIHRMWQKRCLVA